VSVPKPAAEHTHTQHTHSTVKSWKVKVLQAAVTENERILSEASAFGTWVLVKKLTRIKLANALVCLNPIVVGTIGTTSRTACVTLNG
jgi:hypothetical protein